MQSCNWDSIDVLMQRLLLRDERLKLSHHQTSGQENLKGATTPALEAHHSLKPPSEIPRL